jgi:hypothetical protein
MKLNIFRNINGNFDLARIVGLKASLVYPAPFIWNAVRHGTVPDPASFGTGYALVLAAIGALIGGKEASGRQGQSDERPNGCNPAITIRGEVK